MSTPNPAPAPALITVGGVTVAREAWVLLLTLESLGMRWHRTASGALTCTDPTPLSAEQCLALARWRLDLGRMILATIGDDLARLPVGTPVPLRAPAGSLGDSPCVS